MNKSRRPYKKFPDCITLYNYFLPIQLKKPAVLRPYSAFCQSDRPTLLSWAMHQTLGSDN